MAKNFGKAGASKAFENAKRVEQEKATVEAIRTVRIENLVPNPNNDRDVSYTLDIENSINYNVYQTLEIEFETAVRYCNIHGNIMKFYNRNRRKPTRTCKPKHKRNIIRSTHHSPFAHKQKPDRAKYNKHCKCNKEQTHINIIRNKTNHNHKAVILILSCHKTAIHLFYDSIKNVLCQDSNNDVW